MIIVKLQGGFGNQMFQYAFGKCLATKHNTKLLLDTTFFEKIKNNFDYTPRKYELNLLKISSELATEEDINFVKKNKRSYDFLRPYYRRPFIRERGIRFCPELLNVADHSLLTGYWQTEKYFKNIESLIRKEFTFRDDLKGDYYIQLQKEIETTHSISLHFRRGDYVDNPKVNRQHGICPPEYYRKALEYLIKKIDNPLFFVFSDDIGWIKKHFQIAYPTVFVEKSDESQHSDFRLMSFCKHNIIANSSYSWWSAWLNENPEKTVIAPARWFADNKYQFQTNDLLPDSWIKM